MLSHVATHGVSLGVRRTQGESRQSNWRRLYIPTLMLICFSYPITTVLFLKLGIATGEFNQYFKAALLALSLVSLIVALPHARKVKGALLPILAFFACYGARLINDVVGEGILMIYQTPTYVFGYFFGLTLLPVVALLIAYDESDLPMLYRYTFISLILVNVVLLGHALTADGFTTDAAFSGRVEVAGELDGTAVLNPLTFGIMGAILSAFVFGYLTTTESISFRARAFNLVLLALGGGNILFSASRGPALAFMLVILVTIMSLLRGSFGGRALKIRRSTWFYLAALLALFVYLIVASDMKIFLFDRFEITYTGRQGGAQEERDFLFANAWADFLSSPIIGSAYAVSVGNASPHNVILESLMAVGLIGTSLFMLALAFAGRGLWRLFNGKMGQQGYTMGLASLCLITIGLTSYSIGQSPELWIFLSLVTLLGTEANFRHLARQRYGGCYR
jgi:O-antigen ligase